MEMGLIVFIGLVFVILGFLSYIILLFVLHRFTYKTWMFDTIVGTGTLLALTGWILGYSVTMALVTVLLGFAWFIIIKLELKLVGSKQLRLKVGDRIPIFTVLTTDNEPFTERDLVANAPALLVLYRGWWCPSSKLQLDEFVNYYTYLSEAGLTIFAGSVDGPSEAGPMQQWVGDKITILCNISISLLEEVGIRDSRGAPWYDRILFGAKKQDISMPAALVVDNSGKIIFAYRSARVDDRARPEDILGSL